MSICRRLAYDGRGNAVVKTAGELDAAVAALGGYEHGLYAERWCPYQKVRTLRCCEGSHLQHTYEQPPDESDCYMVLARAAQHVRDC